MNKPTLFNRGYQNITDAVFVREKIIPLALTEGRWNVVVFESYRVAELMFKGMICLSGYTPRETHELNRLTKQLVDILKSQCHAVPFLYAVQDRKGNYYGAGVSGKTIWVFKYVAGIYTDMASVSLRQLSIDELLRLRLEVSHNVVRLFIGSTEIIAHTDSSIDSAVRIQKGFERCPDSSRVQQIEQAGQKLLAEREHAFYSTRVYTEQDALQAVKLVKIVQEASEAFLVVE
jgi:HEPN domain-containing protein